MNENYFEAAVRHWVDGKILEENGEYDNAVCMQGFAAECAMKKILSGGFSDGEVRRYSHQGETLLQEAELVLTTHELQNRQLKQIFLPMLPRVGTKGELDFMEMIYRRLCSKIKGGLSYV